MATTQRGEPGHGVRALRDTDPGGDGVRRARQRRCVAAAHPRTRSAGRWGGGGRGRHRAVSAPSRAGQAGGLPGGGRGVARAAARRGGARHRDRGGAHELSGGRKDRDGASRRERPLRGGRVHCVLRGAVPGGAPPARPSRQDRQPAQGELLRRADRGTGHALDARAGPRGPQRSARPRAPLDRGTARGGRADRGRRRRRAVRGSVALSPRQRRRRLAARRAGRGGPGDPRGGARAAPARIPGGAAGVGSGGAHVAGGGRQRARGIGGHVVRAARAPRRPRR